MRRIVFMLALVTAGELVFGLPFGVPRFFRPTMLDVFEFSNTQLGDLFAAYGIAATLAYFPGGALADYFSARSLMTTSLFATAAGGLYMATIPGPTQMALLYAYWGVTTVFLFWGALIKTTRDWGGDKSQGLAFGILDGGRGLAAAAIALLAVNVLAFYMPGDARLATPAARLEGFQTVVLLYALVTFLSGVLVWFSLPAEKKGPDVESNPLHGMAVVLKRPIIWAQAAIIICAYCGYKGLDNYSLYAVQVLGMDEVEGARLASYGAWTRPLAALFAGLLADRFDATRSIGTIFGALLLSFGVWSQVTPEGPGLMIVYANFFGTFIAVYALRGIYFALLEENQTPKHITGAAVGMVSLVGYTPDIFFAPIAGRILDADPGIVGHQNYFMFLAGTAAVGLLAVSWLVWLRRHGSAKLWVGVCPEPEPD